MGGAAHSCVFISYGPATQVVPRAQVNGCPAYSVAAGSCGSLPFVNGTWVEVGPGTTHPRRSSWQAVVGCPATNDSEVFGPSGRCAFGKCCAGYCYDDYVALEGGSAAGRFAPPLAPSSTVVDQQLQTNCVAVRNFSSRGPSWRIPAKRLPLLHTFNYGLGKAWGNHVFEVSAADLEMSSAADGGAVGGNLSLTARGGWHLTAAAAAAHSFFVEDVQEELTAPGEWYLEDAEDSERRLWLVPNGSLASAGRQVNVVLAGLKRLVNVRGVAGSEEDLVQNVRLDGVTFAHTAQTYVPSVGGPYEVPSNGDWSVLREGAVWVGDGARNISVTNAAFWRLGGNGVVLSAHARGCTIAHNEFGFLGENGVVSVGTVELNDGTKPTYPRGNLMEANHIHDIGLWTKQVAGYTQFLTARATVRANVVYNTPRAGINLNDNFAGGNVLEENVVFNAVRETSDHGPLNSWARMGFLQTETTAAPSYEVSWNQVRRNLLVCGFSPDQHGFAALDYDDGTEYMNSTSNVLLYSGFKACWHSNNQRYAHNLLVRPDLQAEDGEIKPQPCASCAAGAPAAGSYQARTRWMKNESMVGNTCIDGSAQPKVGEMQNCDSSSAFSLNGTALFAQRNTYYGPSQLFLCGSERYNLSAWQALWKARGLEQGGEFGSRVIEALPTTAEIVVMAEARLLSF